MANDTLSSSELRTIVDALLHADFQRIASDLAVEDPQRRGFLDRVRRTPVKTLAEEFGKQSGAVVQFEGTTADGHVLLTRGNYGMRLHVCVENAAIEQYEGRQPIHDTLLRSIVGYENGEVASCYVVQDECALLSMYPTKRNLLGL